MTTPFTYERSEVRLQLSVRTKVAKGLLTSASGDDAGSDSVWVGYTQQSYWQFFNDSISRPFRTTDHEPEVVYIYPHMIDLPGGWKYRLGGLGPTHQSNGQSLPLSHSWNRVYLVGATEKNLGDDASLTLQGRIWQRLRESSCSDDNPGISDFIGRAEVTRFLADQQGPQPRHDGAPFTQVRRTRLGQAGMDESLHRHRRQRGPALARAVVQRLRRQPGRLQPAPQRAERGP